MSRSLAALAGLVLLCAATWWWWPSEERRVRARLAHIADTVSTREGESDLARMTRLVTLTSTLSPDIVVDAGGRTLEGREGVIAAARVAAASQRAFTLDLLDVHVVVAPDHTRADATMVARVDDDHQDLAVSLRQVDGAWVVDGVVAQRPLRRPGVTPP